MALIDAFAHVSLPRFIGAEEMLRIMDENRVEAAVITTAETCPDVHELAYGVANWPDRFRAIGIALGKDAEETLQGVRTQLDIGFSGVRLTAAQVQAQPELLELLGDSCAIPYVFGPDLFSAWQRLVEFLDRYPRCVICAPHFCGIADTSVFDEIPDARKLLTHDRFLVIFSRRGAFELTDIGPLANFFVSEVGWGRLMWGSEYPVCLWRNEAYLSTADWIDIVGLKASEAQRRAFLYGNAKKHLFAPRRRRPQELDDETLDLMPLRQRAPVWLFPRSAMELNEETHRTLFLAYLARGGDRKIPYGQFIANLLADAARRLEG